MSDSEFRDFMRDSLQKYAADLKFEQETWDRFANSLYYLPTDVSKAEDLGNVNNKLAELKDKHGTQGNHIFYLSTAPSLYGPAIKGFAAAGLLKRAKPPRCSVATHYRGKAVRSRSRLCRPA